MLFEPLEIRGLRLPNRLVQTALVTRLATGEGAVTPELRDRYVRLARGGVGLIVLEAMAVHGAKSGPLLRIGEDHFVPGLRELVHAIRAAGESKVAAQVLHFLKVSRSGWRQKIEDLAADDVRLVGRQYARAAGRAREAGFDAVELHMAHAYTVASFLSRRNARGDGYGGGLEGRLRLAREILAETRREVGPDYPLGVRFDAEEGIEGGNTLAEGREIGLALARAGADYLSVSAGGKFEDAVAKPGKAPYPYTGPSGDLTMPGPGQPEGVNVPLSHAVKAAVSVPVVVSGKIRTPERAEDILRRGQADLVGMARALLADPDWPRKVREGRPDEIVRCASRNVCKALDENFKPVRCFLWRRADLHAPEAGEGAAPHWPAPEPLAACLEAGGVRLRWTPALGEVYGYEVHRAADGGPFEHLTSVRGDMKPEASDAGADSGRTYGYYVRAYELGGRKSARSNVVSLTVPRHWVRGRMLGAGTGRLKMTDPSDEAARDE